MSNANLEKISGEIRMEANNLPKNFPDIKSDEQQERASSFLLKIKGRLKEIAKSCDFFTAPLVKERSNILKQKKDIEVEFAKLSNPFEYAENVVKEKMKNYYLKKEEEAQKLLEKRQKKIKEKLEEAEHLLEKAKTPEEEKEQEEFLEKLQTPIKAPESSVKTLGGTTSFVKHWVFKITDPKKVPLQFWEINEKLVKKAVADGAREISGIEISQDTSVAARTI